MLPKTTSHEFAAFALEILFLPREHKNHIFSPPCNILYIYFPGIATNTITHFKAFLLPLAIPVPLTRQQTLDMSPKQDIGLCMYLRN